MASYRFNSFTIGLRDYALQREKEPQDFDIESIVVQDGDPEGLRVKYDELARNYEAVLDVREGLMNFPVHWLGFTMSRPISFIRGTGVKTKRK